MPSAESGLIFIAFAHGTVFQMCLAALHGVLVHGHADNGGIAGYLVHNGQQNAFHHAAQTTGTGLALDGLAGNGVQSFVREGKLHVIHAQQFFVLDEDALVRVLKEPRNSLVKQYKELLNMDNVELNFTDEALHAIARKTIERKTGARGLRSVMESILLPIMYEVPNDATIIRVTVDEDTVESGEAHLEYGAVRKRYKNQTSLS